MQKPDFVVICSFLAFMGIVTVDKILGCFTSLFFSTFRIPLDPLDTVASYFIVFVAAVVFFHKHIKK